jgi:hypothetical protein
MTEYSRMAKGSFTAVGAVASVTSQFVNLPFIPDYVEIWNYSNIKTAATHSVTRAWWDSTFIDTATNTIPTMLELYSGSSTSVVFDQITNSASSQGINPFSAGLSFQYGPVNKHGSAIGDFAINKASAAQITTTNPHGLTSGDVVIFSNLAQTTTTGMQQIAGIPFVVTVTGTTTFTIPWNTNPSNYTAFNTSTSTGNVGSYKQVLYPALYAPGVAFVSAITLAAQTVISLTMPGNFVVGQEVAFRIPQVWGTTELNSLPNLLIPGSPIYGYVTAVSASLTTPTITVNINSTAYTAFNSNQLYASYPGEKFPQVIAVGDVNSGGWPYTSTSGLYPSPQVWSGNSNALGPTINGPAIQGAFINNTSQGFLIGTGLAVADGTAGIMVTGNQIIWHAYKHDYSNP